MVRMPDHRERPTRCRSRRRRVVIAVRLRVSFEQTDPAEPDHVEPDRRRRERVIPTPPEQRSLDAGDEHTGQHPFQDNRRRSMDLVAGGLFELWHCQQAVGRR